MKKSYILTVVGLVVAVAATTAVFAQNGRGRGPGRGAGRGVVPQAANGTATLDAAQVADLRKMRDEEKLAQEVYTALAKKWDNPVFARIAQAEQRHVTAVERMLQRYSGNDSGATGTAADYFDPSIAKQAADLTSAGSASLPAAYQVGVQIEEMDIADLRQAGESSLPADIQRVYENMERASRNHLRTFAQSMNAAGATYQAQHLSQEDFDAIAQGAWEQGPRGTGQRVGRGPGRGPGAGLAQGPGPGRGAGMRSAAGPAGTCPLCGRQPGQNCPRGLNCPAGLGPGCPQPGAGAGATAGDDQPVVPAPRGRRGAGRGPGYGQGRGAGGGPAGGLNN